MKPIYRGTLIVALLALISASPARAGGGPSPTLSTVPSTIVLVGSANGGPDAAMGQFTVVARDLANNPLNGASIVIDLSACEDLHLCADQLDPNVLVNCAAKTARKFTDVTGTVTFSVLGGSNGAGSATTLLNGARIYGNGSLMGSPTVAAYDLDGAAGVGANDLSAWLTDFGTGETYGRADYDGGNTIGANDLSLWLTAYGAGGSTSSCAASCP